MIPPALPPGWATDLAILGHVGSAVEDRGDHLVVRTPRIPDFHWGHFILVTDGDAVGDAPRWLALFRAAHPRATWVSIGLARMPDDVSSWEAMGLPPEPTDVLTTPALPRWTSLAEGYTARALDEGDDGRRVARAVEENARTGEHEPVSHERFVRARILVQHELRRRGLAAFFGVFADGVLVADLGIVRCGPLARYQWVTTDPEHRRRGLAAHLLGVAARWAGERGCERWVIVTETTNPAGRLYRSVGFAPDVPNVEVYRPPPR